MRRQGEPSLGRLRQHTKLLPLKSAALFTARNIQALNSSSKGRAPLKTIQRQLSIITLVRIALKTTIYVVQEGHTFKVMEIWLKGACKH